MAKLRNFYEKLRRWIEPGRASQPAFAPAAQLALRGLPTEETEPTWRSDRPA